MPLRQAPIRPAAGWRFRAGRPDGVTLGWLLDPGSLTARLVARARGDFRVRVTRLAWARPTLAETRELAMRHGEWALVREVVLEGHGEPWVVARSVIPGRTLTGRNRQLRRLGSRPLGAFLFRDPTLVRRGVHIVKREESTGTSLVGAHIVWGRRSTFILRGKPLLVAEYFLPALLGSGAPAPYHRCGSGPMPATDTPPASPASP